MRELFWILFGCFLLLVGLFGLAYVGERIACGEKWEQSGFKSDFGFFKGCVIQLEDGTWIPADNYREVP